MQSDQSQNDDTEGDGKKINYHMNDKFENLKKQPQEISSKESKMIGQNFH